MEKTTPFRMTPVRTDQVLGPGLAAACAAMLRRDLLLAFRQRQDLANPLAFFVIVISLFPLGVSPEASFLREAGVGILWVAALLATLLGLDQLFRNDFEDGSLEQWLLLPQPTYLLVLVRVLAYWLVTGVPLILLSPVLGVMLQMPGNLIGILCLTLLLGTPVLSLIGAIGAALTVGLRGGGVLLSLLVLPLYIPVLIFATGTVVAAGNGLPVGAHLSILGAILALAFVLAPIAAATALRISVANT
ncbi:heme exporter protein CcmB [Hydrocarboniclastica marina]|tara:strand:- start:542 stop:1279 length:738 start_codon:yes stop_codon:yes gene_type:complete